MKEIKNIISLCDGIACGKIALDRVGVKYEKYYASEINKYPIKVAKINHPDIIHIGNIYDVKGTDYTDIDLVQGGTPCQGFSFAGKMLNFSDPRSKLFFEFVRILNEVKKVNPNVKFLYENVKLDVKVRDIMSEMLGVQPIEANSSLVSAQNRVRWYWTNIPITHLPVDKGIYLSDIVDDALPFTNKAQCILSTLYKENVKSMITRNKKGLFCCKQVGRRFDENGVRKENDKTIPVKQRIEARVDGKSYCLTTVTKDYMLTNLSEYRKFTPDECEKLQTLPVGYTSSISNTQRYKCIGEGWTVDMIAHFYSFL